MHSVCQETIFVCRKQRGRGWEINFRLRPLLGPQGNHCTSRSCILQNQTTIRPLRHILGKIFYLTKSPCGAPGGSGLDQNCTCRTRPWGRQNVTLNRSLRYLVTEEIEEQDIVYGQTDGRTTGYRISSTGLRLVELKIKTLFLLSKCNSNADPSCHNRALLRI